MKKAINPNFEGGEYIRLQGSGMEQLDDQDATSPVDDVFHLFGVMVPRGHLLLRGYHDFFAIGLLIPTRISVPDGKKEEPGLVEITATKIGQVPTQLR